MKTLISRRSFLKAAGVLGAAAALSACGGSNSSDRKSTRLNSSHANESRMPSSA